MRTEAKSPHLPAADADPLSVFKACFLCLAILAAPEMGLSQEFPGFETPNKMVHVQDQPPGKVLVRAASGSRYVQVFDLDRMVREEDLLVPSRDGTVSFLAALPESPEAYVVTTRPQSCRMGPCRLILSLERLTPWSTTSRDDGFLDVALLSMGSIPIAFSLTTDSVSMSSGSAWIAIMTRSSTPRGDLYRVDNIGDFHRAVVKHIEPGLGGAPVYESLVPSPIAGEDALYALHDGGIDRILTRTNTVVPRALRFPDSFQGPTAMTGGVTELGKKLLFVAGPAGLLAYDAQTGQLTGDIDASIPDDVIDLHLSIDGRSLLLTRYRLGMTKDGPKATVRLLVLGADNQLPLADALIAECDPSPPQGCQLPAALPMAISVDAGYAIVSNPIEGELVLIDLKR